MHPKNKNSIPLENLLDEKYITKLFNANLKKNYPEFIRIDKLQILIIKERLGDDFEHVVANYSFLMARVIGKEKKYLRLNIFCSAHSDGSRKKIMEILKFVNRNNISSQKALFYDNKTQAMFYEGVRGQNLYYYIQHQADIKRYVKEVAIKLASLHKLKIDPKLKISKFRSSLWSLDPSNVLGDKEIKLENCKIEIIKLLNYIKVEFKKLKIEDNQKFFIHGDFHP
ncbi:MAG: phosphotransferase, partial [Patescibacteria group bacterium]